MPSTRSNLAADGRPASRQPTEGAAARSGHGVGRGADLSLFGMATSMRLGLVLIPVALLWAAIYSLLT